MEEKNTARTGWWEYVLLGAVVFIIISLFMLNPRKPVAYENEYVEVVIAKKEIVQMDGDDVYLLRAEDRYGQQHTYEINKAAIGNFEEEEVYQEIKTGKYYKLRIADAQEYDGHYPCICGAVKLIDGFSPEEEINTN